MAKRAKTGQHKTTVHPDLTKTASGAATPEQATNGPTRADFLFFVGQVAAIDRKVEEVQKERRALRSQMKLRGFNLAQFAAALAERDRNDNTTISNLKDFARYCTYLELPIGSQMQLFDAPNSGATFSQEAVMKRARARGYELGIQGLNADTQAYPPMTPEGQEHMAGWDEAQKEYRDRILDLKKVREEEEMARAAKRAAKAADKQPKGEDAEKETEEQAA